MPDFDPDGSFWIIPAQPGPPPPEAIGSAGPLSAIWRAFDREEHDRQMAADRETLTRAQDALANERREWEREKTGLIQGFGDGIARMAHRLDALMQSRSDRHQLDALSEATEKQLQLPEDAIDPDAAATAPGVAPGDPPPHETAGSPGEYSWDDQGDLPPDIEKHAPAGSGTMPVVDPAQLAHPNPDPPTPAAIGGN